ncbi:MAG: PEP-CTERM sorting domain-containing protein [Pseudomonadota bacterium]
MKFLKLVLFTVIFGSAFSANALLLSDVHEFNAPLISGESTGFNFNLVDHGYNHLTDTITNIKVSFDFREIVETEEDMTNVDDMSNWEFIIFYSWIFDGRSIYADIDTGTTTFETSWSKDYSCQYYDYADGDEVCLHNLDLYGEMSSWFVPYTDNLWLGEARLDAEITRASIPEPASILLLSLGLIGLGMRRRRRA